MGRYRKKPVVIEAFQAVDSMRLNHSRWPDWLRSAQVEGALLSNFDDVHYSIWTLDGLIRVSWGDWIIRGVMGEIYPCKPEIFEATYEEVVDDDV